MNYLSQNVFDMHDVCPGNTVGEGINEHKQVSLREQGVLKRHALKTGPIEQDAIGFQRIHASDTFARGQTGANDQETKNVILKEESNFLTLTRTSTPFDSLKRKAYSFFCKLSGFPESSKDFTLNKSHCSPEGESGSVGKGKQLAKIGDYIVLSMPLEEDVGMSMS